MSQRSIRRRLHFTEVGDGGLGRQRRGRGTLKTASGSRIAHQVEDLCDTLQETNQTMAENERMLSQFQDMSHSQTRELDSLRKDLERSRELHRLEEEKGLEASQLGRSSSHLREEEVAEEGRWRRRLEGELDRERTARERAELRTSRALDLLDCSLRSPTYRSPTHFLSHEQQLQEELEEKIRSIRKELSETQLGFTQQEVAGTNMERRVKDIEQKLTESSSTAPPKKNEDNRGRGGGEREREDGAIEQLSRELMEVREELRRREAVEREKELQQEVKGLESKLVEERCLHSETLSESQRLSTKVGHLGARLEGVAQDREKALSQLEATTRRLDESIGGREELLRQLAELRSQLGQSEEERTRVEEHHASLLQQCRLQELTHERLTASIRSIESRLEQHRVDRETLERQAEQLKERLAKETEERQTLREKCQQLETRVEEGRASRIRVEEELQQRINSSQWESRESQQELLQLTTQLKSITAKRSALEEQVHSLEVELGRREGLQERLGEELRGLSSRLGSQEEENSSLVGRLEATLRKLEFSEQEKNVLQARVVDLESELRIAEKRSENTHSQALQALKKYKLRCRRQEQEKLQLNEEKSQALLQFEEVQHQLQDSHFRLENSEAMLTGLRQENSDLKDRVTGLGTQLDHIKHQYQHLQLQCTEAEASLKDSRRNTEKYHHNLLELQGEKEALVVENHSLKQELSQTAEHHRAVEERLAVELERVREEGRAEIRQLQHELQASRGESTKLLTKLNKFSKAHQAMKADLNVLRSQEIQWREEGQRLGRELEQAQLTATQREQELSEQMDTLRVSHGHELEQLRQKHHTTASKLQEKVTKFQLQLADEQSTVRALRRQQVKALDDQHRFGDDLSKSLEDTEKLRRKYSRSKRFYEDKAAALEAELSDTRSEENESLRRQLTESRSNFLQHAEDQEVILRAVGGEVDALVEKLSDRAHVPGFPTAIGQETDARKWIADILAKLQWLQKEADDILLHEDKLKRQLQESTETKQNFVPSIQSSKAAKLTSLSKLNS